MICMIHIIYMYSIERKLGLYACLPLNEPTLYIEHV
jgi:hypothetical protein